MTLPDERLNAMRNTRKFLLDLLRPDVTPRVPKAVREKAYSVLRHYPTLFDLTNEDSIVKSLRSK